MKKALSLISGGIDSPVASYLMIKQGLEVVFIHFHNETVSKSAVENKVVKIVKVLSKEQKKTKLYLIPFKELQFEIIKQIPARARMLVYRRVMFMIADKIAEKEDCEAFITGDSLGQVASQTIENLNVIYEAAKLSVLTPLIGENKEATIKLAQKIGTFEISKLPYEDCCSFLIAKHPETKAKINLIKNFEENLELKQLIEKTTSLAKVLDIRC